MSAEFRFIADLKYDQNQTNSLLLEGVRPLLVVHVGDALFADGEWLAPGARRDGTIHGAAPKVERTAETAASKVAGVALLEALGHWEYESALGPEILPGFIGAAMLGGAPKWRVHALTVGKRGSGKSWLADLVAGGNKL